MPFSCDLKRQRERAPQSLVVNDSRAWGGCQVLSKAVIEAWPYPCVSAVWNILEWIQRLGGSSGGLSLPQPNDNQLILSGMQWYQVCKISPSPTTFAYGNSTDFHIITR